MRSSWVRECHLASKVDSEVPMVQKDEKGTWRIYTQGNQQGQTINIIQQQPQSFDQQPTTTGNNFHEILR